VQPPDCARVLDDGRIGDNRLISGLNLKAVGNREEDEEQIRGAPISIKKHVIAMLMGAYA